MKEEWLFPSAVVPVDVETTAALVAEIKRLIDVVGSMALAQSEQDCAGWFGYDTGLRLWFETDKGEDNAIPLYKDPLAYINITTSDERIEFLSSTGFGSLLVNSLVTVNGKTIGECNRALLHDKLDAWLNKTWEKNT